MAATLAGCDPCDNDVIADVASPSGSRHAVVFQRACGATTGFSTQVSVLPAKRSARHAGNVFVADTDHGRAPSTPFGGPDVHARWITDAVLQISYDPRAQTFARESLLDNVRVRYTWLDTRASRP